MTSRIRIQPLLIEVPPNEPFANDLLGRREFAETLARTLAVVDGPGVFAIDGGWGTGKTTFVRMFSQHLGNEGFRVVNINAWETDYADSPLAALVSSLADEKEGSPGNAKFKQAAVDLLKVIAPTAIRVATSGILNVDSVIETGVGDAFADLAGKGLARFEEHAKSMANFKKQLGELAIEETRDKPMIVIVDELDRCRPTYAVEMLETIKHAFDVDNLLFLLALNRKQLDQSAKTLYGEFVGPDSGLQQQQIGAESYFKRFFDVEVGLPEADREGMVREMLRSRGLPSQGNEADMLATFLAPSPHTIRAIERTLNHYGIVVSTMQGINNDEWWWIPPTVFVLRMVDDEGLRAFLANRMSDEQLSDRFFSPDWTSPLRGSTSANLIEAALMTACNEWAYQSGGRSSSLRRRYEPALGGSIESKWAHASEVLRIHATMVRSTMTHGSHFSSIVERVEKFEVVARQMR